MEQLIVNDIDAHIEEQLRQRAQANGHSLEQEVKDILRAALALRIDAPGEPGIGTRMARRFAGIGVELDLSGFRGQPARGVSFGK